MEIDSDSENSSNPPYDTGAMALQENKTCNVVYIHSEEFERHLNKHPRLSGAVTVTHNLIKAYELLKHVTVIPPQFATTEELKSFHSEEYIEFLRKINNLSEEELLDEEEDEMEKFGIGYDCPFIPQIFDAASVIGGATVTAAKALLSGKYQIAVNWGGGWHHAKKDQADGFCYVNDIVLGILQLLQKYKRVLYIDLDLHHGDGVEEAFAHTSRVLCFSVHKHEIGFYPGTGILDDIGFGKGKYYTINVPLFDGIQDAQYIELVIPLLSKTYKKFQPDIVVCQCGADTLAGDPFAAFNLTLKAPGECIKLFKSWNVPLLAVGGGGYNAVNTARCWTYLLSLFLDLTVDPDIPDHKYLMRYGPDYEIHICPRTMPNRNSTEHLKTITDTILMYISPNTAVHDIKLFLGKALLLLSTAGFEALEEPASLNYCEQPVILAGDFSISVSVPETTPLLEFPQIKFLFNMINGRNEHTTKGGTTIDAVFIRKLDN